MVQQTALFTKFSVLAVLVVVLMAVMAPVCADTEHVWKTVLTDGVGAGPEKAKARDEAIQDALRKAVGQGLGLYIDAETVVLNGELLSDAISTKTKGYVHNYQIVSENYNAEKDLYWVRIKAQLSMKRLEDDLDDLWERIKLGSNPRIMLAMTATDPDDEDAVTNAMIAKLVTVGFKVLDDAVLNTARQKEAMKLVRDGQADAQDVMILQDKSDIVVVGRYTPQAVKTLETDPQTYSMKSTLSARIVTTDSAQIIAAASGENAGVGFSAEDAVRAARQRVVEDWFKRNIGSLVRMAVDPCKEYQVRITGCTHAQVLAVDEKLFDSRFVRKTDIVAFDKGYAQLSVQFSGTQKMLATHLATAAGVPLEIDAITANTIRAHVSR